YARRVERQQHGATLDLHRKRADMLALEHVRDFENVEAMSRRPDLGRLVDLFEGGRIRHWTLESRSAHRSGNFSDGARGALWLAAGRIGRALSASGFRLNVPRIDRNEVAVPLLAHRSSLPFTAKRKRKTLNWLKSMDGIVTVGSH